jgi:hypothetical protein
MNGDVQRSGITNPALEEGMVENQNVTTMKLNMTKF